MIKFLAVFGESSFTVAQALYKAGVEYLDVEEEGYLCRLYYIMNGKRYRLTLNKGQLLLWLEDDLKTRGVLL